MVATLSELQASLASLKKIQSEGAGTVQDGDKRVVYRTMTEIDRAITATQNEIAVLEGTKKTRQIRVYPNRGLY